MSNIIVIAFSPRNIVGCLLKKRLTKRGSRAPQDPPRYALGGLPYKNDGMLVVSFRGANIVNRGKWLGSLAKFFVLCFCSLFWP